MQNAETTKVVFRGLGGRASSTTIKLVSWKQLDDAV